MAVKKIIQYPNPILEQVCEEVNTIEEAQAIAKDLIDTLNASEIKGVGIAAPQIGINKRAFLMRRYLNKNDRENTEYKDIVVINPILKLHGNKNIRSQEGCLSITKRKEKKLHSLTGYILRHKKISLKYVDVNFRQKEMKIDDFYAIVIQHEYDHLDGKLFIRNLISKEDLTEEENKNVDQEVYNIK